MEVMRYVITEPIGNTEAEWSSGHRSSLSLPDFAEGEFEHLTRLEPGLSPQDLALRNELRAHMQALLEAEPRRGKIRRAGDQLAVRLGRSAGTAG